MNVSELGEFPTTLVTKHGRRLVVSPLDKFRYDIEYLDEFGQVVRYRPSLTFSVVNDLMHLEGWQRV